MGLGREEDTNTALASSPPRSFFLAPSASSRLAPIPRPSHGRPARHNHHTRRHDRRPAAPRLLGACVGHDGARARRGRARAQRVPGVS